MMATRFIPNRPIGSRYSRSSGESDAHSTVALFGIVVIEAEKIDLSGSTNTLPRRYTMGDIGRDRQGEAADQRSACARRHAMREARWSARRTGGDRACARALQQGHAGKKARLSRNADYGNEASRSNATRRAPAHDDCKIRWQQTQFVEPRRAGPCAGNNRRCMQGRSRQPMSAPRFPGTSGRAASKSAMGNSTPYPNYCSTKFGPSWPIEKAAA
jgi:hypothetical protein